MDYMNNPTEREQRIARESADTQIGNLEIWLERKFTEQEKAYIRIILRDSVEVAIQDAQQQGNEDTARLERLDELARRAGADGLTIGFGCYCSLNYGDRGCDRISEGDDLRSAIDAARGVQPAAKDSNE